MNEPNVYLYTCASFSVAVCVCVSTHFPLNERWVRGRCIKMGAVVAVSRRWSEKVAKKHRNQNTTLVATFELDSRVSRQQLSLCSHSVVFKSEAMQSKHLEIERITHTHTHTLINSQKRSREDNEWKQQQQRYQQQRLQKTTHTKRTLKEEKKERIS